MFSTISVRTSSRQGSRNTCPIRPGSRAGPWTSGFAQEDTGVEQDYWTAEEVEEHLIAARAINDKQAQAAETLGSEHDSLKEV